MLDIHENIFCVCILLCITAQLGLFYDMPGLSFQKKNRIGNYLANRRWKRFQGSLKNYLCGPDGDYLSNDQNDYEWAMQEVLSSLELSFVVIESVMANHLLIPQCRNPFPRAFLLEYRVVKRESKYQTIEEQLRKQAKLALDKINSKGYASFPSYFRHVKEVVKIGMAFFNRSEIRLRHETEYVNRGYSDSFGTGDEPNDDLEDSELP